MAYVIVFTFRDNKGKKSTCEVKIPTGLSVADMVEFAQDLAVLLDAVTVGVIVSVSIGIRVDISGLGLTGTPGSTADVEERGTFQFQTAGDFLTSTSVPCLSEALVVSGSDALDQTDSAISDFIDAMVDGLVMTSTNTVEPCDSREDDITSLVFARERFRASGKRAV